MARMTEQERKALVQRFTNETAHMTASQLRAVKSDLTRKMSAGRYPIADVEANYQVLNSLMNRIAELDADEATRRTQDGPTLQERAQELARFGGMSAAAAEAWIKKKGDPLDVLRKDRRPAPPPEQPAPEGGATGRSTPDAVDFRPYRMD